MAWNIHAHEVISTKITWTQEISRIFYAHCTQCHRDDGSAPMPLVTYQQVRPWAKAIEEEIHERRMPPWGAMKGFGEFIGDNSLSTGEIRLVADWVEGGAPEGEPQYLPPLTPSRQSQHAQLPGGATVGDGSRLSRAVRITGISPPSGLAKSATLQVVALLPDGAILPLLWLYNFQPRFARRFTYRDPVRLPAGTVVRIAGTGKVRWESNPK